jgi:hypothetical protein
MPENQKNKSKAQNERARIFMPVTSSRGHSVKVFSGFSRFVLSRLCPPHSRWKPDNKSDAEDAEDAEEQRCGVDKGNVILLLQ